MQQLLPTKMGEDHRLRLVHRTHIFLATRPHVCTRSSCLNGRGPAPARRHALLGGGIRSAERNLPRVVGMGPRKLCEETQSIALHITEGCGYISLKEIVTYRRTGQYTTSSRTPRHKERGDGRTSTIHAKGISTSLETELAREGKRRKQKARGDGPIDHCSFHPNWPLVLPRVSQLSFALAISVTEAGGSANGYIGCRAPALKPVRLTAPPKKSTRLTALIKGFSQPRTWHLMPGACS